MTHHDCIHFYRARKGKTLLDFCGAEGGPFADLRPLPEGCDDPCSNYRRFGDPAAPMDKPLKRQPRTGA